MMLAIRTFVLLAAIAMLVSPVLAQAPTHTCYRSVDTITADGVLDEATWQYASSTANAVIAGTSTPSSEPMTVQMAWDNSYLYMAFTVSDSDVYSTINTRDSLTWNQDNVEFFAALQSPQAGDNDPDYVEFEWTPRGYIWDGLFDGRMSAMSPYSPASQWNSTGLQIGTTVLGTINDPSDTDTGFIVEVAVPWEDIFYHDPGGLPADGSEIVMNVCRINWNTPANPQEGSSATGLGGSAEYYTWSPLTTDGAFFHQVLQFGTVTFSTDAVPEPATIILLTLASPALLRRRRH